ncbi:unnamed protein product [Hymenolepis diminuta]|uniref:Mos1 transposase HTH domain-containing protein n=1 Tax=Hymenolepis diminuta TaxID=6216 RepID=A0A564YH29_HYMDI|nr:unnamed protein product [Hymenolepis diminuta]
MYTPNRKHIKHISLFEFHQGNAPSSAAKTLKDTYGNDVVKEKTCRRWFSAGGFKKDDFSLKDERQTESRKLKNSILSNCNLLLMKIQPALPDKRAKSLT